MRSKYTRLSLWLKWKVIFKPLACLRTEIICFRNASRLELIITILLKQITLDATEEKNLSNTVSFLQHLWQTAENNTWYHYWEEPSSAVKENSHISLRKSALFPQTTENSMFFYNAFLLKCTNFKMLVFPESYRRELLLECSTLHVLTNIRILSQ